MRHDDEADEAAESRLERIIMSRGCLWLFSIAFALMAGLAILYVLLIIAVSGM